MSTVHVTDVCRALWHLTSHGNSGDVFNLADESNTSKTNTITTVPQKILGMINNDYLSLTPVVPEMIPISHTMLFNRKQRSPLPNLENARCNFEVLASGSFRKQL